MERVVCECGRDIERCARRSTANLAGERAANRASTNPGADKWVQFLACTDILCTGAPACGGANSCSVCVDQYCQNAELTITATVHGYLFGKCTVQCATGDTTCLNQCAKTYPDVQGAALEFESCVMQHCPGCQ